MLNESSLSVRQNRFYALKEAFPAIIEIWGFKKLTPPRESVGLWGFVVRFDENALSCGWGVPLERMA